MTQPTTEAALYDAIHNAKAERMKAQQRGDLDAVSQWSTKIGELTAQVWRLRQQERET